MPEKYRLTKTVETQLKARIDIREGDDGGFTGTLMLCDERENVVESRSFSPEDLDPIVTQLTGIKTDTIRDVGAVLVETEEIPIEIDLGPEVKSK